MGSDANKMSSASGAASSTASQKSSSKVLISILLFALVLGGGAVWFVEQRDRTAEAGRTHGSMAPKYIVHLEGFTVNLADLEETHFLRATIDLGIDHLPEGADKEKLTQAVPVPRIRDAILSVLTVSKANDLLTPEGKAQLKKDLIGALNRNVPEIGVREIYFTEFLVQR